MKKNNNKTKTKTIVFVVAIGIVATIAAIATITTFLPPSSVKAQILEKDDIPNITLGGNVTTLGEIDLSVDFSEPLLPPNGTQTLSTAGITDIDITSLPPPGFTLIMDNQTATVTLHPVQIMPDTSADDSPSTDSSNGDGEGDEDD